MYYKVIKDGKIIDVLQQLVFVKYRPEYKCMILCGRDEAQGIISSDGKYIWHEKYCYKIPIDGYDTVEIQPIDKYEYEKLKMLNLSTPEEIIDAFVLSLMEGGVI